jgi:hypothetical protein
MSLVEEQDERAITSQFGGNELKFSSFSGELLLSCSAQDNGLLINSRVYKSIKSFPVRLPRNAQTRLQWAQVRMKDRMRIAGK